MERSSFPKLGILRASFEHFYPVLISDSRLEPAPVSPHTVDDPAWRVFAGTIKGVYATRPGANVTTEDAAKVLEVAPLISPGVSICKVWRHS